MAAKSSDKVTVLSKTFHLYFHFHTDLPVGNSLGDSGEKSVAA